VSKCKLRLLRLERIKDFLLLEEEFLTRQAVGKPREQQDEEEKSKVDELRGSPMSVGSIEELIDDTHAIVSSPNGPEYYVNIMSFVDKDQLEPGSTVLLHNKQMSVVGLLGDDVDPMVNVMKVDKAPTESYADIGGLQKQIQEVKEAVELPMTHPEMYEDIGIKPPKGVIFFGPPGTGQHAGEDMRMGDYMHCVEGVSTHASASWCGLACMQARRCLPRPWQTRRLPLSCAWWVPS